MAFESTASFLYVLLRCDERDLRLDVELIPPLPPAVTLDTVETWNDDVSNQTHQIEYKGASRFELEDCRVGQLTQAS